MFARHLKGFSALQREKPKGAFMSSSQTNLSILRKSTKEITFCSLKHYSNISTFLSCSLMDKSCLERVFHSLEMIWAGCVKGQLISEWSAPLSGLMWMLWQVSSVQKHGHSVTPLTSFTAKCKKLTGMPLEVEWTGCNWRPFLKRKITFFDPRSFHLLTAGAALLVSVFI